MSFQETAPIAKSRHEIHKGRPGEPIEEGTTFGWVIHGGDDHITDQCMFVRELNDYERLYSLDVREVEDRGENDQVHVLKSSRMTSRERKMEDIK